MYLITTSIKLGGQGGMQRKKGREEGRKKETLNQRFDTNPLHEDSDKHGKVQQVAEKDTKLTLGQDTTTESLRATDSAQKGRGQPMFLPQIHNSETAYSTEDQSSSPRQFLKMPCTGDLSHQETPSARCPSIKPAEHAVGFLKVAKSGHHFAISA